MGTTTDIQVLDLSPFRNVDDDIGKKAVITKLTQICSEDGFFQVVNHGVPLDLMARALEMSKTYFALPSEEKLKSAPPLGAPFPAGYNCNSAKQDFFMCAPGRTTYSVFPTNPPEFRDIMEELFACLTKAGQILEGIISECMGLPPSFLKEFHNDRNVNLMLTYCYAPATEMDNIGSVPHEDGNTVTFVIQDDVGGLEVLKNGQWIPVLSNKKFKSDTHKVVRSKGRNRYSIVFFCDVDEEKWVEPLPQFTHDVGELPKYRGFYYKDYKYLRLKQKNYPSSRATERLGISEFEIPA